MTDDGTKSETHGEIKQDETQKQSRSDDRSSLEDAIKIWESFPPNFRYILIGLSVLFISTRLIKAGSSHIFTIIVAYFIVSKLQQHENQSALNFNEEMDYRLEILGAPSHFHMDPNIINLFFNIFGWRKKNPYNFDHAIKAVNNILQIEQDTEKPLKRCVDNYDIAYDQKNIAMNLMHGFVYNIDHPLLVKKLKKVLVRLQELLERHLITIQKNCDVLESKKDSIDVNSRFIQDAFGPKPYDENSMTPFDYYQ